MSKKIIAATLVLGLFLAFSGPAVRQEEEAEGPEAVLERRSHDQRRPPSSSLASSGTFGWL